MASTVDRSDLLACIAVCELVGIVPGYLTREDVTDWYQTLEMPERAPPNWVFAPVWTILYLLMGVALYLTRRDASGDRRALGAFALQLGLNALWTLVFFGQRTPLGGLVVIALLLPAVALTVVAVARVNRTAGLLLVPYLAWVAFAATLNLDVWRLNR